MAENTQLAKQTEGKVGPVQQVKMLLGDDNVKKRFSGYLKIKIMKNVRMIIVKHGFRQPETVFHKNKATPQRKGWRNLCRV